MKCMSTWQGHGVFMATQQTDVTVSPYQTSPIIGQSFLGDVAEKARNCTILWN